MPSISNSYNNNNNNNNNTNKRNILNLYSYKHLERAIIVTTLILLLALLNPTVYSLQSKRIVTDISSLQSNLKLDKDSNHCSSKRSDKDNQTIQMSDSFTIHYKVVKEEKDYYIRYAAFIEQPICENDGNHNEKKTTMKPLSVLSWAELLSSKVSTPSTNEDNVDHEKQFAVEITNVMKKSPYKAFFFETKGVSSKTANKQFEFVLINAPQLHSFCQSNGADLDSFAKKFNAPLSPNINDDYGCTFGNLSGDAQLVAPKWDLSQTNVKETTRSSSYAHLATFLREAPMIQIASIWKMVATQYFTSITNDPTTVWLSTSGLGVSYLHFRLDQRPKYYQFREFAQES